MSEPWTDTTVGEWAPFHYGKGLPERARIPGTVPVYGSNGVVGWHNEAAVEPCGVVIGRKGTVGSVEYCAQPFWPIDTTFFVRDDPRRDLRFTAALLSTLGLEGRNSHSAVPGLSREDAHSLSIQVPPLGEQRRIAAVLSAVDDRIESRNSLIRTLDDRLQLLAARAIQRSQSTTESALTSLASVTSGYSYKGSELVEVSDSALVNLKNFGRHGGFRTDGLKPLDGSPKPGQVLKPGDVIVAKTDLTQGAEVIGRCLRLPALPGYSTFVASLDVAVLRPLGLLSREVLLALLSQAEFRDHCIGYTNGTTVLHLASAAFDSYVVEVPDPQRVEELEADVVSLVDLQDQAYRELQALADLRSFLLTSLISGELRVAELGETALTEATP